MLHRPYASGEVEDWPLPPAQSLPASSSSKGKEKQSALAAYLEAQKEKEYKREVRLLADEHATSLAKGINAAQELIELAAVTVPKVRTSDASPTSYNLDILSADDACQRKR